MRLALVAAGNLFFVAKIDHGLAQAGVAREDVANAEAALAARRAGRGDLLILDLGHRGQDALDFLAAVKSDPAGRGLPVLAYVAHVDEARRARAEALGAERVVTQGELSAKLPRLLAEVLGQGTPRQGLS